VSLLVDFLDQASSVTASMRLFELAVAFDGPTGELPGGAK
jgi:hypothetical protein